MRGKAVSDDYVASRWCREVVSKTSAYNITKLSYRVEVRVRYTGVIGFLDDSDCIFVKFPLHSSLTLSSEIRT